jgi:ABC-type branched-subunit amino acid transport system substrate-binding protein
MMCAARVRSVVALLVVGALAALAGCNSTGFSGAGGGPRIQTNAPVTGQTIGTGSVRIALLLPLSATGNAGQIAQTFRNAADLALRDFKTSDIQILVKDDLGTPDGGRAAATEAISEGAQLILGPLFAGSVAAVSQVARASNIPVIAFSTDTTQAAQGVYLLSFLPQSDVDRIIGFAASRGKKSFAALIPNNAYGTVIEAALQRAVANASGRVMTSQHYDLDKLSMQQQANSVATLAKSGTIDSIFMPDAGDAAPFLAQVMAADGIKPGSVQYLGSGQWDDPRIAGESNLTGGWFPGPDASGFNAFAKRYQAAFGAAPYRAATLAYDATSLAAGLSARFGDQRFSRQTLTNPNGFIGVDGAFRFLPNGLNQRGLAVYEVKNGQSVMIDPAPKSFAKPPGT